MASEAQAGRPGADPRLWCDPREDTGSYAYLPMGRHLLKYTDLRSILKARILEAVAISFSRGSS